jgi:CDP-glycerol glycerophosphotransferase
VLQRLGRPSASRVLFNSFNGQFSDSPRAIYEELVRRGAAMDAVWMGTSGFPPQARAVEPYTLRYLREAGRAGLIVSNIEMPRNLRRRPGTTYLQTWHGTPLKRVGFDNPRWDQNPAGLERMRREFAKWDYLVSQNPFSTEIFRRAFRFDGDVLEVGYPRNDILHRPEADDVRRRVRADLGIEDGVTAVLYAPTWRDNLVDDSGGLRFSLALDVERMAAELGSDHALLLRMHYLLAGRQAEGLGSFGLNVSDHPDIRELYLAADVLVTDYSSAMFDFAVTGKPIVFFTYDLEAYRDGVRGFYFDLEAEAPGPVCRTSGDLVDALRAPHAGRDDSRYAAFRERFCPYDDGQAAARVVDRVMGVPPAGSPRDTPSGRP